MELVALSKAKKVVDASAPTPFGILVLAPPEIRLQIYRYLFAAKSVQFLETSKTIYNEAIDILRQEGVCSLEFKIVNVWGSLGVFPSRISADTILNLEIRLDVTWLHLDLMVRCCIDKFNDWLPEFIDCQRLLYGYKAPAHAIPRKSCKILLDLHYSWRGNLPSSSFEIIRCLVGFETLVLAIANDYERPDPRRNVRLAMHNKENKIIPDAYENAKKALEPSLGPAKWISDEKGTHMEFHPRAYNCGIVGVRQSSPSKKEARVIDEGFGSSSEQNRSVPKPTS